VILGSVASAGLAIVTATRIAPRKLTGFFRMEARLERVDIAWSLALSVRGIWSGCRSGWRC